MELVGTGKEVLDRAAWAPPDLVLLSLELPDMAGTEALSRLRERSGAPVIALAPEDSEALEVAALDAGADDCVSKPVRIAGLLARVRAQLRRAGERAAGARVVEAGDLRVDLRLREASVRGEAVLLTPMEWELLRELALRPDRVVPRRGLVERVWGREYGDDTQGLRTLVRQLRKKLEPDPAEPRYILTEARVGYRLCTRQPRPEPRLPHLGHRPPLGADAFA